MAGALAGLGHFPRVRLTVRVQPPLNPLPQLNPRKGESPMSLSLGTMFVHKLYNWQDQGCGSVEQAVSAFLTLGEAIAARCTV